MLAFEGVRRSRPLPRFATPANQLLPLIPASTPAPEPPADPLGSDSHGTAKTTAAWTQSERTVACAGNEDAAQVPKVPRLRKAIRDSTATRTVARRSPGAMGRGS